MTDLTLGVVEARFADIIWEHEPIGSRQLAEICSRELDWKRPTTYNVLRKLTEKGIFQNRDCIVTSLLSREEFYGKKGERFVAEAFAGSLPAFIAAFTQQKALTPEEIAEIRAMIDAAEDKP
ncbi:MAG TPA: BlaI/MecI/CopY family transcriptional regulator [Clostridiaceae bacterium]|nr:BlaI/MecI/CopY family transcriptional regulator [Clostridiaceae bacterium]